MFTFVFSLKLQAEVETQLREILSKVYKGQKENTDETEEHLLTLLDAQKYFSDFDIMTAYTIGYNTDSAKHPNKSVNVLNALKEYDEDVIIDSIKRVNKILNSSLVLNVYEDVYFDSS